MKILAPIDILYRQMDHIPEISSEILREIFHKGCDIITIIIFLKTIYLVFVPGSGCAFTLSVKIGANSEAAVFLSDGCSPLVL